MGANDSNVPEALKLCQYLWDEYKYRHDLIWQRIFRFTTAVVLISLIPYVQQNIAHLPENQQDHRNGNRNDNPTSRL